MSYDQWKYGTNFSSYGAFELKLFENTFVAFIKKHPVGYIFVIENFPDIDE